MLAAIRRVLADILRRIKGVLPAAKARSLSNVVKQINTLLEAASAAQEQATTKTATNQVGNYQYSLADAADIAAERKTIEETAKSNGTYLKAPNGQPTNLSPKQWVDVRTKRFKAWFGDWELAELYHRAVVAWSSKDSKGKVILDLSDRAKSRFAELLDKDIKQLIITDDAIRHIKNRHGLNQDQQGQKNMTPEDIVIIPYLVNNYDSMELIPEYNDNKGNRAIEIKKRINGVSVVATIEKGSNKEFLVTSYQFVKSDALDASTETSGLYVRNDSDIAKVQKDIENIKLAAANSSKIVDANGEPKVTEHSTWNEDFYTFDINRLGESSGESEQKSEQKRKLYSVQEVNDRFNEELATFKARQNISELHLGVPSPLLRACGVSASEIFITSKTLRDHLKKSII